MKDLGFLVSLTTAENDYQIEQAAAAEKAARRLGIKVEVIYADNDAVTQSQQILKIIQSTSVRRPHAIVLEPVSITALPQVARAAVAADIGWVVLNSDVNYVSELRRVRHVPVFAITSDHLEIGRIQGRQMAALLPEGGTVLYIQGPSDSSAARQRTAGMQETKPANVQVRIIKAQWTEASATKAVSSWLALSTSRDSRIDLVSAQDDSMAMGARKALQEYTGEIDRVRLLSLPFTGCDGLPATGQAWVQSGQLAATVVVSANTDLALDMLVQTTRTGIQCAERTSTMPISYPSFGELSNQRRARAAGSSR
jgi:ribose transport system substrate-binding protein